MTPERPQIDKPEGDIPFDLGIEDIVVGDGDEATAGNRKRVGKRGAVRHRVPTSHFQGKNLRVSLQRPA